MNRSNSFLIARGCSCCSCLAVHAATLPAMSTTSSRDQRRPMIPLPGKPPEKRKVPARANGPKKKASVAGNEAQKVKAEREWAAKSLKEQLAHLEPATKRRNLDTPKGRVYWGSGWAALVLSGQATQKEAADDLGVTNNAVGKWNNQLIYDWLLHKAEWERKRELGGGKFADGWIDIYSMTDEELEEVADYFASWRERHFTTPQRTPYVTKSFHRRWIVAILRTIRDNGNLLILSPPRHGKTELLIHFDIFFITRVNPNISIVRVCKSEGLAKKGLASVMDHLENNEELRDTTPTIRPGETWQPPFRSGKPWNSAEFTVATRNITGLKSPTVAAVGAGGTLLSRDGDVFVVDDIEDQQTVYTADMREKRRTWFHTDLMSRKTPTNCVIYIGSRQHPDDVPGRLIDNPEWEVIIERAHDEAECQIDNPDNPENWEKHDEAGCVLWPELRPYSWLMGIKNDPERASSFPMIYLNHPTDENTDIFSRSVIEVTKDVDRITHSDQQYLHLNVPPEFTDTDGIHHPIRLVAGIDPSGSGYQATFLWGVDLAVFKLYAVDYENRLGGGLHRAADIMQRWYAAYGVRDWVIEENLYHGAFLKDETIRAIASRDGLTLHPHQTGTNKWDPTMGVGVLARMMLDGDISIPWGNVQTQAKWKLVTSQFINFSRDGGSRRSSRGGGRGANTATDIVMASWFPLALMQRWRRDYLADRREQDAMSSDIFAPMSDVYSSAFADLALLGR